MKTKSKFERQRRSKLWAATDRLDRFAAEERNTATWVDEHYAQRLERHLLKSLVSDTAIPGDLVKLAGENFFLCMASLKDSVIGVILDLTKGEEMYSIAAHSYDNLGYARGESASLCLISRHAMLRLFERRRTNAFVDLGHTLRELVLDRLTKVWPDGDFEVKTKTGTFYLTHEERGTPVVKTYIEDKP